MRVIGIDVLLQEFIVNFADDFTGLQGNLHFFLEVLVALLYKELKAVVFRFEVFQQNDFRLAVRVFHIIDVEFLEVADYDPAGAFGIREFVVVALGLLEGLEQGTVALGNCFAKVLVDGLLLNEGMRRLDIGVDEAGAAEFDLVLELNYVVWAFYTQHRLDEFHPERLAFTFFVSFSGPPFGECLGRCLLLILLHTDSV